MNLTKKIRQQIIEQFKAGCDMSEIGVWHCLGTLVVEGIIREWMVEQEQKNALPT